MLVISPQILNPIVCPDAAGGPETHTSDGQQNAYLAKLAYLCALALGCAHGTALLGSIAVSPWSNASSEL